MYKDHIKNTDDLFTDEYKKEREKYIEQRKREMKRDRIIGCIRFITGILLIALLGALFFEYGSTAILFIWDLRDSLSNALGFMGTFFSVLIYMFIPVLVMGLLLLLTYLIKGEWYI